MAADINNVTVVGRLGRDPELRSTKGGTSVCSLRIAVNDRVKGQDGEWDDRANWMDVTVWGSQGEAVSRNLTKGRRVGISGSLRQSQWEDKEGNRREKLEVNAFRVQFLDSKDQDDGGGFGQRDDSPPAQEPRPATNDDDDIPF